MQRLLSALCLAVHFHALEASFSHRVSCVYLSSLSLGRAEVEVAF